MASWEEQDRGWLLWTPDRAAGGENGWIFQDVAQAVDDFEPVDQKAGHAATEWLRSQALDAHPDSETWLLYEPGEGDQPGRLEGFFSICKSNFLVRDTKLPLRRKRPASEITWLCKHRDTEVDGRELIRRAISVAKKTWKDEREITLMMNPYDTETAKFLYRKHVFWQIAPDSDRLWMPIKWESD